MHNRSKVRVVGRRACFCKRVWPLCFISVLLLQFSLLASYSFKRYRYVTEPFLSFQILKRENEELMVYVPEVKDVGQFSAGPPAEVHTRSPGDAALVFGNPYCGEYI